MPAPRVLVAEDEMIVAFDLCNTVEEAGYIVEGPHGDIKSAMKALENGTPDIAILDVNLTDGETFELAEMLIAQNVPVIFHSGHFSPDEVNARFPMAQACAKPCPPQKLLVAVQQALSVPS